MQPLIWERRPDGLRAPALVCAFKGWNDAGDAASAAVCVPRRLARRDALRARSTPRSSTTSRPPARRSAHRRAHARDRPGRRSRSTRRGCRARRATSCCCAGAEPSMRWRTFSALIVDLAEALGTQMVVTLGALLADVPHSRPVAITGLSSDDALVERLGLQPPSYEGPTGHRRRPARRLRRGRACRRRACGPACPTTSPPRRTRRRRSRSCASSRAWSACPSTPSELEVGRRRLRAPGRRSPCRAIPTSRRSSSAWSRPPTRRRPSCARTDLPSGDVDRPRVPALPAPARARGPGHRRRFLSGDPCLRRRALRAARRATRRGSRLHAAPAAALRPFTADALRAGGGDAGARRLCDGRVAGRHGRRVDRGEPDRDDRRLRRGLRACRPAQRRGAVVASGPGSCFRGLALVLAGRAGRRPTAPPTIA